ncbi:hypothetical protein NLJ89_g861 [Agrocybe chaxingu]|uniref:G domain-containing protein n=1 Tax=Agrocybe chaxingu TaxID=84603 RepID=A0A9W8N125_9AGAR|nr:hypothetical protein NLJ89_g861 [Agrocybe chaxingu]
MDESDFTIAIMGATGSGKTSFINTASESDFLVGQGLQSCTEDVKMTNTFRVDGRPVRLVDTPGFDDTTRSDFDILKTIADYLTSAYKEGKTLSGVIYTHRITDTRMSGISRKNFRMFRKVCGESTLKNVVIMTNMWGSIEQSIAEAREEELANEELCFKPVLEAGAKMLRHAGTRESAHDVLRHILGSHGGPVVLDIQKELVDEHKDLENTAAGDACIDELAKEAERRHQEGMQKIQREMEEALKRKEEEDRRRLEEETRKRREGAERVEAEARRIAEEIRRQREEQERRIREKEERAREEARRAWEEHERRRKKLEWEVKCAAERAERERQELRRRIEQERRRQRERDRQICIMQ